MVSNIMLIIIHFVLICNVVMIEKNGNSIHNRVLVGIESNRIELHRQPIYGLIHFAINYVFLNLNETHGSTLIPACRVRCGCIVNS